MNEEMKVDKEKWSQEIGIGQKNQTLAACINSLIAHKHGIEWNEETTKRYLVLYNEKILPLVSVANTKAIKDFTADDIEDAVYKIKILVNPRDNQEYDSVEVHLRLLRFAIEEGIANGWCDETILFGTSLLHETEEKSNGKRHRTGRLRKSLTPKEELTLFQHLTKSVTAAGELIGLLFMLVFGLRNNETCPLTWNKIQPLETNPNIHVLYIVESSKKKKKEAKDTGKTKNFPRIIPIPKCIYDFLMRRKEWIRTYVEDHYDEIVIRDRKLKKLGIEQYIGKLRIVCHGDDIFSKTRPDDLSAAGKKLLAEVIGFNSHSYYLLNEYLKLPENRKELRDFRDPTSYLLRRNFATSLLASMASMSAVQYLMGHFIEDPNVKRYDYSNPDRLEKELYPLMERRPLYTYETQRQPITCPVPYSIEKVSGKQEYVIPMRAGRETEIEIQAYEPNDVIDISVSCCSEVRMIKKVFSTDYKNQALAENLEKQYRSYRAAEKQLPH